MLKPGNVNSIQLPCLLQLIGGVCLKYCSEKDLGLCLISIGKKSVID